MSLAIALNVLQLRGKSTKSEGVSKARRGGEGGIEDGGVKVQQVALTRDGEP